MYTVLSSLAACGRLGVAARPACLFGKRPVARDQARVARWRDASRLSQSSVSSGRRQTCLNLSVLAHVLLVDSLVVTLVEFPTFCCSSLRRAGLVSFGRLVVDTSGELSCGNERIIGAAVRSVRAVGSLYVTVLGSAAYKGARYLVRVWRGSRRDLTRLRRLL